MKPADSWIALDWGTSRLRAWHMSARGEILDSASSDQGMSSLMPEQYEPALLELVRPWLVEGRRTSVAACGMVGARQGWVEAPYASVPWRPGSEWIEAPVDDARIQVRIASGVKQLEPVDVMRGEETQIAGLLAAKPDFEGVVCLPGTHSKWVRVADGAIQSFQTFMTGELFGLLAEKSVLQHTLPEAELDPAPFRKAVTQSMESPESVASQFFALRAGVLQGVTKAESGRSRLSGWLIGHELAMARPHWEMQKVVLVCSGPLAEAYQLALEEVGVRASHLNVEESTLTGLQSLLDESCL